jgi:hypothetical protein
VKPEPPAVAEFGERLESDGGTGVELETTENAKNGLIPWIAVAGGYGANVPVV